MILEIDLALWKDLTYLDNFTLTGQQGCRDEMALEAIAAYRDKVITAERERCAAFVQGTCTGV